MCAEPITKRVQAQFGDKADAYTRSAVHASPSSLQQLVALVQPQPEWLVLDIATGAGHTAHALATHVEEVMGEPEAWYGKRLQLHGFVVKDSILRKRDSLDYRFKIESQGAVVDARYTGIVPDTFQNNSEVVIKGTLGPDGFDVAPNGIMAKCPSKYEPGK